MTANAEADDDAPMVIRRGSVADVALVRELAERTFRDTYLPYDSPADIDAYTAEHFTEEAVSTWFRDPDHAVLLAWKGGACIGYVQLARTAVPECVADRRAVELHRFYLSSEQIGRGQGRALLNAALSEAKAMGHATLWLLVYEKNLRAREFYRHVGFVEVGTAVFMFGGLAYHDPVMQISLPPSTT